MDKNNIDYSKYVVTLEEYEKFFFEYIGMFGILCFKESWESNAPANSEYEQYHELASSSMYNEWRKNYEIDYFIVTCHYKYDHGIPDADDINRPIYISELECEQIVSILTVEYHKSLFDSRHSFINSLGVKFVKETYLTYYKRFACHTPSGFGYLPYSDFPVEKWSDKKLFATYSCWFSWIRNPTFSYVSRYSNLFFEMFEQDELIGPFTRYNLHCFELAVFFITSSIRTYFTPKIVSFLFQDLKIILEKNMEPGELESKNEVRVFMINVFKKLYNQVNDLDADDEWVRNQLSDYYLFEIFKAARDSYSSGSIFHTKCWARDFTVGNRRDDGYKFFRSKL